MSRIGAAIVAAMLLSAAPAAGSGLTFDRALGLDRPQPFDCTTASGCQSGASGELAGQLASPSGSVVVGSEIFVADRDNNRVSVFDAASGAFVRAFGKDVGGSGTDTCTTSCRQGTGSGASGALNRPWGIAAEGGEVYVADAGNHRIEVFTTAGAFERSFGGGGSAAGQMNSPHAIAVSGGEVYVADYANNRIDVFTTAGTFERALGFVDPQQFNCTTGCFGGAPLGIAGGMSYPTGSAVSGGEVYVADQNNNRIDVFTTAGVFERAFGHNVDGAGGSTCTTSCQAGDSGGDAGWLSSPTAVAISGGELYVADYGNERIDVFTTAGVFVRAFAKGVNSADGSDICTTSCQGVSWDVGAGQLRGPRGIAVSGGEVYVADGDNQRVDVFTTAGAFERAFGQGVNADDGSDICTTSCQGGQAGGSAGQFYEPSGVAVDGGEVYVADFYNSRIDVFSTAGVFARMIGRNVDGLGGEVCTSSCRSGDYGSGAVGEIQNPWGVGVTGGEIYVADFDNQRIAVFTTAGAFERAFGQGVNADDGSDVCTTSCQPGTTGGGAGELGNPAGLAVDSGKVYVAEQANHRIAAFTTAGAFDRAFGARLAPNCTTTCAQGYPGADAGQLSRPTGVAVTGGEVFVADHDNNRVSAFDTGTGAFTRAFGKDVGGSGSDTCTTTCQAGTGGGEPGRIDRPSGVATDGTDLYVTEQNDPRVNVFDASSGIFARAFGKDVGGSGSDTCTTTCQDASSGDGAGELNDAVGPAVDGGKVYVTDRGNHRISVFTAASGAFSHAFGMEMVATCTTSCGAGSPGPAAGQLYSPAGAAISGGEVFVADQNNNRIDVFDEATGAFLRAFGHNVDGAGGSTCTTSCQVGDGGGSAGWLNSPTAVAISGGELYVADYNNERIDVFTTAGVFVRGFAKGVNADDGSDVCTTNCRAVSWGGGAGELRGPRGIAVSGGEVYVGDGDNNRVDVFTTAGVFVRAFGKGVNAIDGSDICTTSCQGGSYGNRDGQFATTWGVAVAGGEVYAADFYNSRIDVFSTAGVFERTFGRNVDGLGGEVCTSSCRNGDYGSGDVGEIQNPSGVLVTGGQVYVADLYNQRIAVFSTAGDFVEASGADVGGTGVDVCTTSCQPGSTGGAAGELNNPYGIALDGGKLFVAEYSNHRVSEFDTGASPDTQAPDTTDDVPASGWHTGPVTVTLSASDSGGSGLDKTYYTTGASPPLPTTGSAVYDPAHKPTLGDGEKIRYFSTDLAGNAETPHTSAAVHVDSVAPSTTDDVPAGYGSSVVTVTLSASDGSGSGIEKTYYTTGASPAAPTTSSSVYDAAAKPTLGDGEKIRYFSTDAAGNAESPHTSSAAKVDTVAPSTTDDVPSGDVPGPVTVTLTASDSGGSGLDKTYYTTGASPAEPTTSSAVYDSAAKPTLSDGERIRYFSTDLAGNAEVPHSSGAVHVATSSTGSGGSDNGGGSGGGGSTGGGGTGGGGTGGGSFGSNSSNGGTTGGSAGPSNPCAGKHGAPLSRCRAYAGYKAAIAKCDAITGTAHRRSCTKRATRAYTRARALSRCRSLKGKARGRCEQKARRARRR